MIKAILIASFCMSMFNFSQALAGNSAKLTGKDTTITANIEKSKGKEKINATLNDSTQEFSLNIGNAIAVGKFSDAMDIDLQVIDIDKDSKYRQIVVIGQGPDDDNDCRFYEYIDGRIVSCGGIKNINQFKTTGDKTLQADSWMGFWTLTEDYYFDPGAKTLVKKPKDIYTLNAEGKVVKKFVLLKNRSDDSPSAGTLKAGTKFTVSQADITPKCLDSEGNDNSFMCHWYYVKGSDGTEGWCRLQILQDNTEGLPWAG